jgi:hypothetical protein
MGACTGDALGLGPHWHYDLIELRKEFGKWIDGYTDPKLGRYQDGLKAGQLSQAGVTLQLSGITPLCLTSAWSNSFAPDS